MTKKGLKVQVHFSFCICTTEVIQEEETLPALFKNRLNILLCVEQVTSAQSR